MSVKELTQTKVAHAVVEAPPFQLVLWNDEVNTFDWVIECLVDICNHEALQAEQCAWIVHTKGKCAVKGGSYDDLRPRHEALQERGLTTTLEVN